MKADDELCFCFHVTWRKVINYIRQHRIQHASQVAECYGAGTGCGWCRRQITRMLDEVRSRPPGDTDLDVWLSERTPTSQAHAAGRQEYLQEREPPSEPSA
jgi:bacterioferritin-associated ferredoxin